MGLRRLTAFALAHAAGTALLLSSARALGAEALSGDAGAALLLIAGGTAVLAGARTALFVHLLHIWRACRACGLAAAPVHTAAMRAAPQALRSIVLTAAGGSLSVLALSAPSLAASPSPAWPLTPEPAAETTQDPAWPLTAPDDAGEAGEAGDAGEDVAPGPPSDEPAVHVVSPGESLWQIVAEDRPGAGTAQLTDRIDEVHAANRTTIGEDANLLLPGQRLVLP